MKFMYCITTQTLSLQDKRSIIDKAVVKLPDENCEIESFMYELHSEAIMLLEETNCKIDALYYAKNMSMIQNNIDQYLRKLSDDTSIYHVLKGGGNYRYK